MKKGFTLIELLAVIVILAIIALIATPIVLSIIDETKESASLRSAEFYLDAVELSIAQATLLNKIITDGKYNIIAGDICLDTNCTDKLIVEIKGEKPSSGTITVQSGKIEEVSLNLNDKTIMKDENGALAHLNPQYKIGDEVTFDPGDGERTWNVIDEGINTITLMLTENLGETVAWHNNENYNTHDNSYGPKDVLEHLNRRTEGWTKVNPIKSYSYINNLNGTEKPTGYQKIEIENGKTTLTHKDGTIITEVSGVTKARLLTIEEVFEIAGKTNENLKEENLRLFIERNLLTLNAKLGTSLETIDETIEYFVNKFDIWLENESRYMQTYYTVWYMVEDYDIEATYGVSLPSYLYQNLYSNQAPYGYWTLSTFGNSVFVAWYVGYYFGRANGDRVGNSISRGPRPVITVLKSNVFE